MRTLYALGCHGDNVTNTWLHWTVSLSNTVSICRITTQILGRKSFQKFKEQSKQPDRWRHPRMQASRQLTGWIRKISRVGRAEFIKRNQLRDPAGLDFVVNRKSVFYYFEASLKPWIQLWLYYVQAGWIFFGTNLYTYLWYHFFLE